jgi:hypothetical protein
MRSLTTQNEVIMKVLATTNRPGQERSRSMPQTNRDVTCFACGQRGHYKLGCQTEANGQNPNPVPPQITARAVMV